MPERQEPYTDEDLVPVGDYLFSPNVVPTMEQIEEAEMFVFSHPAFFNLGESDRRMNVVRLVINSAISVPFLEQYPNSRQVSIVPLIGGIMIKATFSRHEGTIVSAYEVHRPEE